MSNAPRRPKAQTSLQHRGLGTQGTVDRHYQNLSQSTACCSILPSAALVLELRPVSSSIFPLGEGKEDMVLSRAIVAGRIVNLLL
jgi:hypothetical protein